MLRSWSHFFRRHILLSPKLALFPGPLPSFPKEMRQITNLLKDLEVQRGFTWCNNWGRLALKDMAGQVKVNGSSMCGEIRGSRLGRLNAVWDLKMLGGIQTTVSDQILNLGLTFILWCAFKYLYKQLWLWGSPGKNCNLLQVVCSWRETLECV